MEEEIRENGLTFGEIWQRILRRIWYVLGASIAVALAAALIVYFAVNPAQRTYTMKFDLVLPSGSASSYPDGEPFYYRDMITAEYLNDVVKTEGLEKIDIQKMTRDDDIGISAATDNTAGTVGYTVKVKSSYFSGVEQAEKFIRAIAGNVESRMRAAAENVSYAVSPDTFGNAPFEERINLLAQERETILEKYDEWINIYDASFRPIAENSAALKDFRDDVIALFGESVQKSLEDELAEGGYHYTTDFDAYKAALKSEYERNKTEIKKLTDATVAVSLASVTSQPSVRTEKDGTVIVESPAPNVSQRLAELIERNNKILHWLGSAYLGDSDSGEVTATLSEEANGKFEARLDAERGKLEDAANELAAVTKAIYGRSMARFDVQKAETEGGVSVLLIAVVAFVVCFLIAGVIVCVVDGRHKKKTDGELGAPEKAGGDEPEKTGGEVSEEHR